MELIRALYGILAADGSVLILALEDDFLSEVSSLVFVFGKQMELHFFFVIFKF